MLKLASGGRGVILKLGSRGYAEAGGGGRGVIPETSEEVGGVMLRLLKQSPSPFPHNLRERFFFCMHN